MHRWLAMALAFSFAAQAAPPLIPLVKGLTIVTAVEQPTGDYESIKRVIAMDDKTVLLHYSAQYVAQDALGETEPGGVLTRTEVNRRVRRADLESATNYLQQYAEKYPELIAGTTAIGTSRQVLRDLKRAGKSELTVFQMPIGTGPANPMERQAGDMDFRLPGTVERVQQGTPATLRVIVNDRPVDLPVVRAKGMLAIEDSDFFFLDDEANPLTLRFDIGRAKLRVIRISFPPGADRPTAPLEPTLARDSKTDVYGLYFDFNSAVLRPESDTALAEIAAALNKNPGWKLKLNGHTDGIGGAAFNRDLSRRRAAAVRQALAERYGITATRLSADGLGATQPKAPNTSLEGRALNRRVELVRLTD